MTKRKDAEVCGQVRELQKGKAKRGGAQVSLFLYMPRPLMDSVGSSSLQPPLLAPSSYRSLSSLLLDIYLYSSVTLFSKVLTIILFIRSGLGGMDSKSRILLCWCTFEKKLGGATRANI